MPAIPYSEDPVWEDVMPIPQDDGGPNALATINYADDYREATNYLRAIMAANEHSLRVLSLTDDVISMNPAHYTVWLYRAQTLAVLHSDLHAELRWLNDVSLRHIKNYQIWHHRQTVLTRLAAAEGPSAARGEQDFLARMFEQDAKNYHVWSYRQWLVRTFDLWPDGDAGHDVHGEIKYVEMMLDEDVRNNSAWNHRWFLVFGRGMDVDEEVWQREVDYAKSAIELAPQNESSWSYLRGLLRKRGKPYSEVMKFAQSFASLDEPEDVRSSYALDLLADAYAEKGSGREEEARKILHLLATKYDAIRANYWNYRKSLVGVST